MLPGAAGARQRTRSRDDERGIGADRAGPGAGNGAVAGPMTRDGPETSAIVDHFGIATRSITWITPFDCVTS